MLKYVHGDWSIFDEINQSMVGDKQGLPNTWDGEGV